jgi:D-glycero-alpha-D-manno-heptose-7-phosphate kinase
VDGEGTAGSLRIVNSVAPIRVCDNGGWTDTWFARHGKVFNIGVSPYAEVQLEVFARAARDEQVTICAENFAECFGLAMDGALNGPHPLLQATVQRLGVPAGVAIRVTIYSQAPSGASTGTSAAVAVALIGALDCLTPGRMSPSEVASTAQAVEVEMLGQQCGIQDQLCSAFGGINLIDMHDYPRATVSQLRLPDALWWELEQRLVLVYLGHTHRSSDVHERVIRGLEDAGPDAQALEDLRRMAEPSRDALQAGDFAALGRIMVENTEAQRRLHPDLVGVDAQRVMDVARAHGALGWKVNGAGGEGGSLTILAGPAAGARRAMIREIEAENTLYRHIPTRLSRHGLRTWEGSGAILAGGGHRALSPE